jgi:hypothetical protein
VRRKSAAEPRLLEERQLRRSRHQPTGYPKPMNHRARATHAMLASEMGSGLPQLIAQAIGEMHSRLDLDLDWFAV